MIHPGCKVNGHNWANWAHRPSEPTGEVCPHDDDTFRPKANDYYRYRRECQTSGCSVVELADRLVPEGRDLVLELEESVG